MAYRMLADIWTLICIYVTWKLLLLCIAYASPGPGYDTSTHLLLLHSASTSTPSARFVEKLLSKLVRWDALYFVSVAHRGYLFEQEWAWGLGYTKFLSIVSQVLPSVSLSPLYVQALAGVIVSHVAHFLSVIALYGLACQFPFAGELQRRRIAIVAASLHIFSSAGLFLSAPYSESLFSALNFLGFLFHARIPWAQPLDRYGPSSMINLLMSGACFGMATTIRSNGVFSGLLYVHHVYLLFYSRFNIRTILTVAVIGISAVLILSGMLLPQYIAYQEFCTFASANEIRPWCSRSLPSIYTWVQEHYWNVGFLRYWTISNLPLFLLALPMLSMLVITGFAAPSLSLDFSQQDSTRSMVYLRCLALPQMLLALLAFTTFHVQIINRIATGYPLWYIVLAVAMTSQTQPHKDWKTGGSKATGSLLEQARDHLDSHVTQQAVYRGMFMYSIIQGGLYASFMPPA